MTNKKSTETHAETHACDLISRRAAIDAIMDEVEPFAIVEPGTTCVIGTGVNNNDVVRVLEQLPSAQPEQRWILCDEIMPEEHEWIGTKQFGTTMSDEVYVTFENSKGERFTKHLHFHNGDLSRYDKTHMDAWFKKDYKPIAWMPLPEPYKGEQHG